MEADLVVLAAGLAAWGSRKEESIMTLLSWASNSQMVPVTEMGHPGGEAVVWGERPTLCLEHVKFGMPVGKEPEMMSSVRCFS